MSINLKAAMERFVQKESQRVAPKTLTNFYQTGNFPFKLKIERFRRSAVAPVSIQASFGLSFCSRTRLRLL